MNKKKILMILLLLIFIAMIVFAFFKIKEKSTENNWSSRENTMARRI